MPEEDHILELYEEYREHPELVEVPDEAIMSLCRCPECMGAWEDAPL